MTHPQIKRDPLDFTKEEKEEQKAAQLRMQQIWAFKRQEMKRQRKEREHSELVWDMEGLWIWKSTRKFHFGKPVPTLQGLCLKIVCFFLSLFWIISLYPSLLATLSLPSFLLSPSLPLPSLSPLSVI